MRSTNSDIGREDRRLSDLLDALHELGNPGALDLVDRLSRCRTARMQRRGDLTTALRWGYRCRNLACWSCARSRIGRKAASIMDGFKEADNNDCSLLTICLCRTPSLDHIGDIVKEARKAIRNVRDRKAASDKRWQGVSLRGTVEMDAVDPADLVLLPPQRQTLVPLLPIVGDDDGDVWWLPHLHLCVHHPNVDRADLHAAFEQQYPGLYRVNVTAFYDTERQDSFSAAEVNAFSCASYALGQACSTTFTDPLDQGKALVKRWPLVWQAQWFAWLHGRMRSLQSLQVKINASRIGINSITAHSLSNEFEAMACVFSSSNRHPL